MSLNLAGRDQEGEGQRQDAKRQPLGLLMKVFFHGYSFHPLKEPSLQVAPPRRHFKLRPGRHFGAVYGDFVALAAGEILNAGPAS
jgi:hypothetical protein